MKAKSTKPDAELPIEEEDEPFRPMTEAEEAEMDAFLFRNREAINASIRRARENFARGESFTLDEVMARVRKQLRSRKDCHSQWQDGGYPLTLRPKLICDRWDSTSPNETASTGRSSSSIASKEP